MRRSRCCCCYYSFSVKAAAVSSETVVALVVDVVVVPVASSSPFAIETAVNSPRCYSTRLRYSSTAVASGPVSPVVVVVVLAAHSKQPE